MTRGKQHRYQDCLTIQFGSQLRASDLESLDRYLARGETSWNVLLHQVTRDERQIPSKAVLNKGEESLIFFFVCVRHI